MLKSVANLIKTYEATAYRGVINILFSAMNVLYNIVK